MMKKYWFVFIGNELLLEKLEDGSYTIPFQDNPPVLRHLKLLSLRVVVELYRVVNSVHK